MSHTQQLLADAEALQQLLANPAKWIQHRDVRHDYEDGRLVERVCVQGGAIRVTGGEIGRLGRLMGLLHWVLFDDVVTWNDDCYRTHTDITTLLAQAVAEAQARIDGDPLHPPPVDRVVATEERLHREQDTESAELMTIVGVA